MKTEEALKWAFQSDWGTDWTKDCQAMISLAEEVKRLHALDMKRIDDFEELRQAKNREIERLKVERELESEIAYHSARSDIECYCKGEIVSQVPILWWYDTTTAGPVEEEIEWVEKAVQYLEQRGLLQRHPENPNLVRPLAAEAVRG